jgi:hypothetical protein
MSLTFGIEIECIVPFNETEAHTKLAEIGIDVMNTGYEHTVRNNWKMMGDSSINSNNWRHTGIEFVSPILQGEDGLKNVRSFMNALNKIGATVNSSCGFHVHVGGMGEQPIEFFKNLWILYSNMEPVIDKLMPLSRRENQNTYCLSVRSHLSQPNISNNFSNYTDFYRLSNYVFSERYWKINMQSWDRQRTVEFRHHSGTLNAAKAINWINICLKMVEKSIKGLSPKMNAGQTTYTELVNPNKPSVRRYSNEYKIINLLFEFEELSTDLLKSYHSDITTSIGSVIAKYDIPHEVIQQGHKKVFKLKKIPQEKRGLKFVDCDTDDLVNELELTSMEAAYVEDRIKELNQTPLAA